MPLTQNFPRLRQEDCLKFEVNLLQSETDCFRGNKKDLDVVVCALNSSTLEAKAVRSLCEFAATLVYMGSSRLAPVTQGDSVSRQTKLQTKKKKKKRKTI